MLKIKKNILITGAAGFIGFSYANELLSKGYIVYGIDNFDEYYSLKIKKKRIKLLKKCKNFVFKKIDITNKKNLINFLSKKNFSHVFHFAAQPGVRYSFVNPQKYLNVNINGFINLLNIIKNKKVKKFFYASSSSVYGDTNKFPVDENQKLTPKNPYGISKVINEELASIYSLNSNTQFIGLRFFTIYGELGRPDMFIIKFIKKAFLNKKFELNNSGEHYRDFTYIKDVIKILNKLLNGNFKFKNDVFNICTSRPIYIKALCNKLKRELSFKKVVSIKLNKADVLKTHGNNKKLLKLIGPIKFTKIDYGVKKILDWSKNNKNLIIK